MDSTAPQPRTFRLILFILGLSILLTGNGITWRYLSALPAGLKAEYVGVNKCAQCHQAEYQKWLGSHHDLAMDPANSKSVLGNFENATFESNGVTSTFFTKGDKYFVETAGRDGKLETFELPYTFGVEPLQQYLAKFPEGRMQALPIAWDTHKKEWFHLYEKENLKPDEWLYWTNWGMNWNHQCAECHSTNLQKNYDPKTNTYHTTWTDIDVSCEACHGPGSIHLEVAEKGGFFGDWRYGTGLAPLKGSTQAQVQIDACARCHARRQVLRPGFQPGDTFTDFYHPELLDTAAYYPDGQIHDEDYEYGSFHLSLMHAKGVRCTDCHDPHTAKILAKGNQLCVRCHIPAKYDSYVHHYHPAGSTGSQCVECHMPETTYMTVDPRRDHSFRIPRPDQTISMGLPNACNRCHKDKTPEWSLESVNKWYPKHEWPRRTDFAKAIEGGRQQDPTQEKPLIRYARDPLMPTLLRASAFSLLGNYESSETTEALIAGTTDPDILAKIEVARAFEPRLQAAAANYSSAGGLSSGYRAQVAAVAKLLGDNARSVRTEAARALAAVPKAEIPAESRDAYEVALAQCIEDMRTQQDVPVANYNLANLYANLGKPAEAEKFYRAALKLDPSYNVARFNLAMLLYQQNRPAEAIREFQSVLTWAEKGLRTGDDAVTSWNNSLASRTHYSLGLLLAEDPAKLDQAAVHLSQAAKLDSNAHRALYNLGLAYQQQERWEEAEDMLRQAQARQPNDADYLYALGVLAAQRNRPDDAKRWLMALVQRHPQHVDGQMLLQRLSRP